MSGIILLEQDIELPVEGRAIPFTVRSQDDQIRGINMFAEKFLILLWAAIKDPRISPADCPASP